MIFCFIAIAGGAQVSFAIVCNGATDQLEIVVEGRETSEQKILKGGFPNQSAAETYKANNTNTLSCGSAKSSPPPTTAARVPQNQQQQSSGPPSRATPNPATNSQISVKPQKEGYPKTAMWYGAITQISNAGDFYQAEGAQKFGLDLGLRLFFGQKVKFGFGVHYTSLLGLFEPVVLDRDFGDEGITTAIKGEVLSVIPFKMGNSGTWFYITPSFGYYFNHMTDIGLDNDEIFPALESALLSGGVDVGVDIFGFNIGVGVEVLGPLNELSTSNATLLKIFTGYSF